MASVLIAWTFLAFLATASPADEACQMVDGEVWIEGGGFVMGDDRERPEKRPAHEVTVDGFWIDTHEVQDGSADAVHPTLGKPCMNLEAYGEIRPQAGRKKLLIEATGFEPTKSAFQILIFADMVPTHKGDVQSSVTITH